MNRPYTIVLSALALCVAACESPLSPGELLALGDAEARWARRSFEDYAFEIRRSCFCDPFITTWARVEVVGGAVSRVVFVESGAEATAQELGRFPTVEGIFARIRAAMDDESLEDISVEFDPALGFPTRVVFQTKPDILDGGISTYVRNVGPQS